MARLFNQYQVARLIRLGLGGLAGLVVLGILLLLWLTRTVDVTSSYGHQRNPVRPVPAIIIPVVRSEGKMLLQAVAGLGFAIDKLVIVDNSDGDCDCEIAEVRRWLTASHGYSEPKPPMSTTVRELLVLSWSTNVGTSGAWNAALTNVTDTAPWALVTQADVVWEPGGLRALSAYLWDVYASIDIAWADWGVPGVGNMYSLFALSQAGWQNIGRFDENFYPAYAEDCDHWHRVKALGARTTKFLGAMGHSKVEARDRADAVVTRTSSAYRQCASSPPGPRTAHVSFRSWDMIKIVEQQAHHELSNNNYYKSKWGSGECGGGEYPHPYNDPALRLSEWRFDAVRRAKILQLVEN